jgi:hypothetical protein
VLRLLAALLLLAVPATAQQGAPTPATRVQTAPPPTAPATVAPVPAAPAPSAQAPTPTAAPVDEFESWLAVQRDARGRACNRRAVEALGNRWVVAFGESGLWTARRNPGGPIVLVSVEELGGPVVALFRREGRVWAEVLRREARDVAPVDENASQAAFPNLDDSPRSGVPTSPPATVADAPAVVTTLDDSENVPEGRVTEVSGGEIVVDLGRDDGVRVGDRVELSEVVEEGVGSQLVERRRVLAVGVVRAVSEDFARVELGMGERVPVGATARSVTRNPTRSRSAPPRVGGLWHVGFMARPFVALEDLGGGILLDASVGYRFEGPIHIEAVVSPLGWATGESNPSVTPAVGFVKGSFDSHLFEIGFGFGVATVHDVEFPTESGSGFLVAQQVRIGAVDGLSLDVLSHVTLFHSRFRFSGMVAHGQIPMGDRFWLLIAGGGGAAGYGYGELGVRALLRGNGDKGSFFFTGTVGGVGVFETVKTTCSTVDFEFGCSENVVYAGPTIGAGGEWRF